MEPLTATINGFTVPATRNANPLNSPQVNTPTAAPIVPVESTAITPESLKTTPQAIVPVAPVAPVTQTEPTFTNEADRILQESKVEDTEAQQLGNKLSERIFSSLQNLTGEQQALGEAQIASGVGQFKKQLQDINSQILKKYAEVNQDDIKVIQSTSNLEQQKIPMEFITGQQQSVERDAKIARALKMAEIGVLNASALATQGNVTLAMETAQQAVDLKYAPYKEEIALYQAQLAALKPILDKDEKEQAAAQLVKSNLALKDLETRQAEESAVKTLSFTLGQNQAPSSIINEALGKTSIAEILTIPGIQNYLMTPKEKLELRKLNLDMTKTDIDIQKSQADLEKTLIELNESKNTIGGSTGDPITDIILGSSRHDKVLESGTVDDLTQAMVTLGNVEQLQGILSKEGTGIVSGNAKSLLAKVSGNFANAAAVNAQIQRTVPGLARGIFKEVGVLTDADIANYKKTLPNLTSPEEQNKLALLMTLDVIERSIGTTLSNQAKAGRNVSGFASDYASVKSKVNQLKSELGITDAVSVSPVADAYLDNKLGSGNLVNSVNNTVSNYSSQFQR